VVLFRFLGILRHPISIVVVVLSAIVVWNTSVYFQSGLIPAFFLEKGEFSQTSWWLTSFYFHIVSASVCLLVGGPLMFKSMLRFRRTHHFLGYLYFNAVLWVAAPTGLIISPVAKGGWLSALGFIATGIAWWWVTWQGYQTIRKREIQSHIRWMIRSYAIALSAVFFRLIQIGLFFLDVDPNTNYVASVWLSLLASFLLSETGIYFSRKRPHEFSSSIHQFEKGALV